MFAYLDGYTSSSTRAELLGLIISLYSPGPVHTALDNAAVVTFAQFLLKQITSQNCISSCPSFADKNNGDLWEIFYKAVVSKGVHAVRVTKTKGHALQNLPADCCPKLYTQAVHNNRSDLIAKAALHKFYHPNLITLSDILASRHKNYIKFVVQLHKIIFR
eukprot:12420800-Karenia_brevis.AAC.1